MSEIVYSYYVITCANIKNKFFTRFIEQRGCLHEETDENFCVVCDAPMWESIEQKNELTPQQITLGNNIGSDYSLSGYAYNMKDGVLTDVKSCFYIDQSCIVTNFEELNKNQKEKITNTLAKWLIDNEFNYDVIKQL